MEKDVRPVAMTGRGLDAALAVEAARTIRLLRRRVENQAAILFLRCSSVEVAG